MTDVMFAYNEPLHSNEESDDKFRFMTNWGKYDNLKSRQPSDHVLRDGRSR